MSILLGFLRSIFFISVGLYIYYYTRRKQHNVTVQMWFTIVSGMLVSLIIQLVNVSAGNSNWNSIQISFYLSTAIFIYAVWKVIIELRKRRLN